jgi:hypothetical protein
MVMPLSPKALYPLVPNAPGVPALLRSAAVIVDGATFGLLGVGSALDDLIGADPVLWGVFTQSGQPVAIADSVQAFEFQAAARVSDYPVEQGAFASYNKVIEPYSATVRMSRGGTLEQRSAFLAAIEGAQKSLELYTVLTPELSYFNANIEAFDYRREINSGAGVGAGPSTAGAHNCRSCSGD